MAADLRDMLKRVLASEGKKKSFFVYGLGKRKDNKGEGELIVRGKKPKLTEVKSELADAGEVFEGVCWLGIGPETGQTVYFQSKGKKLSNTIVKKMMLTAKTTIGHQYDFQLPSPEEEARADKLTEGEGEQDSAAAQPAPPGGAVPPAPPVGSAPPAPPKAAVPPAPPMPNGGDEVIKRLNAMTANIKAALAGPNKARVQTLFVSVNGLIKHGDFVQAGKVLDELEPLLAPAPAATPPPAPPLQAPHGGADVLHRLNAMTANIKAALAGPNKARVQTLFVSVNGLIKHGDFVQAGKVLDELAPLVQQAPVAASPPPRTAAAPRRSLVNFAKARLEWEAAKKRVGAQLDKLRQVILAEFPERTTAVDHLKAVLNRFNEGLGETLSDLHVSGESPEREQLAEKARDVTDTYLDFVLTSELVEHVQDHPFEGAPVTVRDLLLPTLKAVRQQLPD